MTTRLSWTKTGGQLFPSRWPPDFPEQRQEDSSIPADGHKAYLNKARRIVFPSRWPPGYPEQSQEDSQLFPSRWPPGYPEQSQEDSSFPADGHQAILNKARRTALSQQMATRLSLTKPGEQLFPSRCHQAILNKARRTVLSRQMATRLSWTGGQLFSSRWPPGFPEQSQEDSSFPADGHQAILNKARKTALSQQMETSYPGQSQEDSSFPADDHQPILNKAMRIAISQQMATRLSWTKPGGQLFPNRRPPGYPKQSQEDSQLFPSRWPTGYLEQSQEEDSLFPADGHQAFLNKARRTVFPGRWPPGYPKQSQEDSPSQQMATRLSWTKQTKSWHKQKSGQIMVTIINHNRNTSFERSVMNYWKA